MERELLNQVDEFSIPQELYDQAESNMNVLMKDIKGINLDGTPDKSMFHFERVKKKDYYILQLTIVEENGVSSVYELKRIGSYNASTLIFNWITYYTNVYFWDKDYGRLLKSIGRSEDLPVFCDSVIISKTILNKLITVAAYVTGGIGFIQDTHNYYYIIVES